jgi:hypothetical protein
MCILKIYSTFSLFLRFYAASDTVLGTVTFFMLLHRSCYGHDHQTPIWDWKAIIRKAGWPLKAKTFRTKRDAEDWARRTEDEIVRGTYIVRSTAERMTLAAALKRYTIEVTPTMRPSSQEGELRRAAILERHLGKYSLAALTPEIIAHFRDMRLAVEDRKDEHGQPTPRANNTVRLELVS